MFYKRKIYQQLLEWKENRADHYAVLIEGARRVGKSTVVELFAQNEYESYILINFTTASAAVRSCFDDISNLDLFFLRLQAATGKILVPHHSVIVFDEIQRFPIARQAIKQLVADGRYHYIETGSLISIKKNVKDILIPSEEDRMSMFPMDYEEFLEAIGSDNYHLLQEIYQRREPVGQALNRVLMRDFRIYMAVGGMPQAVAAYAEGKSFAEIDAIKRSIIKLYEEDFRKIDPSGRISAMYHSIPAQLSRDSRRYMLKTAIGKSRGIKDHERLSDLIDSKTVLVCYNTTDPRVSLGMTRDLDSYKMYLNDTGLFVTLMFMDRPAASNDLYTKMLADRLPANLGYLYENAMAQMIATAGRELYYHTWEKAGSTHYYEIDFLTMHGEKVRAIEVKSSATGKHESLTEFKRKYKRGVENLCVVSQKDLADKDGIQYYPIYLTPFLI